MLLLPGSCDWRFECANGGAYCDGERFMQWVNTQPDELLEIERFGSFKEAQVLIERFRQHSNAERPHSHLNYHTPNAFA